MKRPLITSVQINLSLFILVTVTLFSSCSPILGDLVVDEFPDETAVTTDQIHAQIWPSSADTFVFPEDKYNLDKTGICMSGGGTRAMVCAVGQLRALQDLGYLDDVGYISCVSGGSWASVPYTYYTSGAINDDQLLGTRIAPQLLRLPSMGTVDRGFLAGAATSDLWSELLSNLHDGVAKDEIWIKAVRESYMTPFGVYDPSSPRYFSYDQRSVGRIIQRNPSLDTSDFLTVRNDTSDYHRPYLVVNSSISGPYDLAPFKNPEQLAVFNYTPLGVGSAKLLNPEYVTKSNNARNKRFVGGGFIEPFAFGATVPTGARGECTSGSPNDGICVTLTKPTTPFTIADASGTSSSAFVASFTGISLLPLKELSPQVEYWPIPTSSAAVSGGDFMFGDGGNVENMGMITLLQRKVNKLVVFVNTDSPINLQYDTITKLKPTKADMDFDVLTLFGIFSSNTEDMYGNWVFETDDVIDLLTQFVRAKSQGKSVIATQTLVTRSNPWYGIPQGDTIQLTWVYNDSSSNYNAMLHTDIQHQINLGDSGDFPNFPQYSTMGENTSIKNGIELVELTPKQINLLYQFSAWTVYTNREKFKFLSE